MHKISFGTGFMGLLFAAGSASIFLVGFPALWYFVALAAALGVVVAIALRAFHRIGSDRSKPLSILTASTPASSPSRPQMKWHRSFRTAHVISA